MKRTFACRLRRALLARRDGRRSRRRRRRPRPRSDAAAALRGRGADVREPRLRSDRGAVRVRRGTASRGDATALREPPVFDDTNFGAVAPTSRAAAPGARRPCSPVATTPKPLRVRLLRPDELQLGNEYRRLRALAAYRPLVHAGWVQPGLPEADAQPFDLTVLGAPNPSGTIRVHLSRFLHVKLDLSYQATAARGPCSPRTTASASSPLAPRYRLDGDAQRAQRRAALLRSSRVRGAVRVTPVPTQNDHRPPAGGVTGFSERPREPARRCRAAQRARARSPARGSSCAPGGQPMTVRRVVDVATALRARIVQLQLPHVLGDRSASGRISSACWPMTAATSVDSS